jgi:phage terminase small subunit
MAKLTDKQEMFCREYIVDLNATQAAIRAGYSKKTANQVASQNLTKLNIQERVTGLMRERTERVEIDADWVLKSAKKVFDRCMQQEDVTDREGGATGEWKFEHSGANKALEIIGKHVKVNAFNKDGANDNNKPTPIAITIGVKDCSVND